MERILHFAVVHGGRTEAVANSTHAVNTAPSADIECTTADMCGVPSLDEHPDLQATFIVRDGKLVSLGHPRGHLITDAKYENYRLEIEYRFAAKPGNCGVLIHASRPRALNKMFPKSIEFK